MGIIERKRGMDAVDMKRMFVPDFAGQCQDPPVGAECDMVQLPRLAYEPVVAVGVMECEVVRFAFEVPYVSCQMGERLFQGEYVVRYEGGSVWFEGVGYEELVFAPMAASDYASAEGCFTLMDVVIGKQFHWQRREVQRFKGSLRLLPAEGCMAVINDIGVEAYLYSVISSEMNARAPIELLKAHAIISRSWLLKPILDREGDTAAVRERVTGDEVVRWYERDAHRLFDVCADDHCQRYQGIGRVTAGCVAEAIEATRGVVLEYEGHICDARFSKCCGGVTERFESCWADSHYHYLECVADAPGVDAPDLSIEENAVAWIRGAQPAWCNTTDTEILDTVLNDYDRQTQDFYRWRVRYGVEELSELVRHKSGIDFGRITDLQPLERGASGRIVRLRITGTRRSMTVGKELEIRRWLSESHLYSSAFVVERTEDGGFVFIGAGWGHGVGLCQIGAAVMAAKGRGYEEILRHYFRGACLAKLY